MIVGKILIDLWQFWPRGMCLLKRHFPQFSKSWYIFKRIEFKLNVSLEKIPSTIPENWIYINSVFWKYTFHVAKTQYALKVSLKKTPFTIWQIWMSHKFDFKVKDVFWRDTFYNS